MTNRYGLRFETGERRGEIIPITGSAFTVGRRPGNSLQVVEVSVSARHAELEVTGEGVLVRDLGSTNGTRVAGERIAERLLEPGVEILFGSVQFTFVDVREGAGSAARPVPAADPVASAALSQTVIQPAEGAIEWTAEKLARARRGSKLGPVVLLVAVAVGAASAWWYFGSGTGAAAGRTRPVEAAAGNLLADGYSFEEESIPWEASEEAPATFLQDERGRYSGHTGLSADLAGAEWARHLSQTVDTRPGRVLELAARTRTSGDAGLRIGVELGPDGTDEPTLLVWSPRVASTDFEETSLSVVAPIGFSRVRAVVSASAEEGGRADVDDVRLSGSGTGAPTHTLDEYKFFALGDPPTAAALARVDHVLLAGIEARPAGTLVGAEPSPLTASAEGDGIRLGFEGPAATLRLVASRIAVEGGLATMGEGGYAAYRSDFERSGVSDLLLGSETDLVRVRFASPVTVKGRSQGGSLVVRADLPADGSVFLQLRFRAERGEAVRLAGSADDAEARGNLGECLALWQSLLDEYPYERQFVERAEQTRSRLILAGHEEVQVLSRKLSRARFFRMLALYRECLGDARNIAERYAGSEVADAADDLAATIEAELAALEVDLDRDEVRRLEAIVAALEVEGSDGLAAQVRDYLEARYPRSR